VNVGATTFKITDSTFDWSVGDLIVIASNSYDMNEAEVKTISAVNLSTKVFTVDSPFVYTHYSAKETYGST
jgi:hypothetical protein